VVRRYLVPMTFLAIISTVLANVLLLSAEPTSELAWWINQEIYSRLRGLIYLIDNVSVSPGMALIVIIAVGAFSFVMRRRASVCFVANHAAAVALAYAALFNVSVKAAALGTTAGSQLHVLLSSSWDRPALVALLAAVASCIPCHLDYLLAKRRGSRLAR
jgi:hypothetical protein